MLRSLRSKNVLSRFKSLAGVSKSKRTLRLAAAACAVLIGLTLWKKTRPIQIVAALAPRHSTILLKPGPLLQTIDGPGTIVQLEKAAVTSRVIGRLQAFHANRAIL